MITTILVMQDVKTLKIENEMSMTQLLQFLTPYTSALFIFRVREIFYISFDARKKDEKKQQTRDFLPTILK